MAPTDTPPLALEPELEPWRQQLCEGRRLRIWSASGGCWAGGLVIDATESRVKVEYTLNGERCDKTLLRTSTNLRQELHVAPIMAAPVAPTAVAVSPPAPIMAAPVAPTAVAVSPPAVCRMALPGAPPLPYPQGMPGHPRPVPAQLPPPPQARQPLGVGAGQWLRLVDLQFGELLGSGGFGAVHRGRLRGFPKEVAIKKLHVMQSGGVSQANLAEFQKEVNNLQALRHDRLICLIGIAYEPPVLCIVTELAPGGSLHDLLHLKRVALAEAQKRKLMLHMAEGVAYLHGQRPPFVHRDLKSANVVLDEELNARLCDFGITEPMERTHISRRAAEAGSPRYMAPELFDGRAKLTEKLDIWALGCLIIEVLTSRTPHEECSNIQQVATKLLVRNEAPFQDAWSAGFHAEVVRLTTACFSRDGTRRPSAAEILEVFSRVQTLAAGTLS